MQRESVKIFPHPKSVLGEGRERSERKQNDGLGDDFNARRTTTTTTSAAETHSRCGDFDELLFRLERSILEKKKRHHRDIDDDIIF